MITKPLLAVSIDDIEKLKYPVYCTPKYDGIRCLMIDGKAVTRNFKPQPNVYIRELLEELLPDGVDGELVLKNSYPGRSLKETASLADRRLDWSSFNDVQSEVMRYEGKPDFEYHIFDYVKDDLEKPYTERVEDLKEWYGKFSKGNKTFVKIIEPVEIKNTEELLSYEAKCLKYGYEGVIIRSGDGKYKCGRSTLKEGILLKMKRFSDAEATIIGFEEKMHNSNEKEKDAFGHSKRSSKKDGMVGTDTLGALIVSNVRDGVVFSIGTGFDDELRKQIWDDQDEYLGMMVKYKYQKAGEKEKPRFPVFLGFRSVIDL